MCALCALCGAARFAVRGSWSPWCSLTATATTSLTELPHKSFGSLPLLRGSRLRAATPPPLAYGKFINFFIHSPALTIFLSLTLTLSFAAWDIGNSVQDAFVIAVEEHARERLQRLAALNRVTPVDITQLSKKVSSPPSIPESITKFGNKCIRQMCNMNFDYFLQSVQSNHSIYLYICTLLEHRCY